MSKSYIATDLSNKEITFYLDDHRCYNKDTGLYHASLLMINGIAKNGGMSCNKKRPEIFLGSGKTIPWSDKEKYNALLNFDTLHEILASELKELYKDAINIDPSI